MVSFPQAIRTLIFMLAITLLTHLSASAQSSNQNLYQDRERAMRLYDQGNLKAAVDLFRDILKKDKDDGDTWYHLGLALVRVDDMKGARKAFESAVKLKSDFGPAHSGFAYTLMTADKNEEAGRQAARAIELNANDAEAHYVLGVVELRSKRIAEALQNADAAIAAKPNLAVAYLLKSQGILAMERDEAVEQAKVFRVRREGPPTSEEVEERKQRVRKNREMFRAASDSLETYLKLAASDRETETWKEQLETLRVFGGLRDPTAPPVVFGGSEVTTKVRVLSKPEPTYTENARRAGISGTIILRAVFSANGKVEHILVLTSLPGGLTQRAIDAARQIKFTPATKDGKPVSMFMELQYSFNLY